MGERRGGGRRGRLYRPANIDQTSSAKNRRGPKRGTPSKGRPAARVSSPSPAKRAERGRARKRLRGCSQSMRPHFCPHARNRLAVQLAHARFGHAEHGGGFLEVHVVLVVHAHDVLLALGQGLDGDRKSVV